MSDSRAANIGEYAESSNPTYTMSPGAPATLWGSENLLKMACRVVVFRLNKVAFVPSR